MGLLYVNRWEAINSCKTEMVEVTREAIIDIASCALNRMQEMVSENSKSSRKSEHVSDNFINIAQDSTSSIDVLFAACRDRISLMRLPSTRYSSMHDTVESFTSGLKQAVMRQIEFMHRLESDNLKNDGDIFIDRADTILSSASVLDGIMCDKCGEVVRTNLLKMHLQSTRCILNLATKDVREEQFNRIEEGTYIKAIQKAGVGVRYRPSTFSMWAPPWVMRAIEIYTKNGGFGGMDLAEYLERMKPDKED